MIRPNEGVIPAKAGIQDPWKPLWIPACAGMTGKKTSQNLKSYIFLSVSLTQYSILPVFQYSSSQSSNALLPGFMMLLGSNVLLIFFIKAISTGSCSNVI